MAGYTKQVLDRFLNSIRRTVRPTQTAGVHGTQIIGGIIQEDELSSQLTGRARYKTFSEILANTSIVAAGTRYFLNLVAKSSWKFVPAEADVDGRFAELAEQALTDDPLTPFHRIVRRAAMYRFYGFSFQEWTAVRRMEDGSITFRDVAPRAQLTIERWDVDDQGQVVGVLQRSPQTHRELYLPRQKLVYLCDDSLSDSPQGLGIFRHIVQPAKNLARFEQLEGFGFETDLRGIPVGRGPFAELRALEEAGRITKAERQAAEKPLRDFVEKHVKTPTLGLILDSLTYQSADDAATPSAIRQWDVELLQGGNTTQESVASAINRLNHEIARILGTEGLLLGGDKVGSLALSKDKSHNLFLLVDGALVEIGESFDTDLLDPLWALNGYPEEMKPELHHETVQFKDVEQIGATLRDMATAGAILEPDDPAIAEVRALLGLSSPEQLALFDDEDAALTPASAAESEDLPDRGVGGADGGDGIDSQRQLVGG